VPGFTEMLDSDSWDFSAHAPLTAIVERIAWRCQRHCPCCVCVCVCARA